MPMTRITGAALAAIVAGTFVANSSLAETPGPVTKPESQSRAPAIQNYWTSERLKGATPMPLGSYSPSQPSQRSAPSEPLGTPGAAPGSPPKSGVRPQGAASTTKSFDQVQTFPPFSPPSSPTDFANYAPFQRFTWP